VTFLTSLAGAALTTNNWTLAGSGKWETATNWSSASAPSLSDAADFITNATTKTVTIDATTTNTPSAMMVSNLAIAGTATSTNTLFLNNAGTATPLRIIGTNTTLAINTHGALVVNNSAIVETNGLAGTGDMWVGETGGSASLTISNGGVVLDNAGIVGGSTFSNTVLVTGLGSVWSNAVNLNVGFILGGANQMIISNGGVVYTGIGDGVIGNSSSSNSVLVTGLGSRWNCDILYVGSQSGGGNQMIISNGGAVHTSGISEVGINSSSSNAVLVTGPGSVWNAGNLNVGLNTSSNRLTISNGGAVSAFQATIGDSSVSSNNVIQVTGGSLVVVNAGNAQLVVSQVGGKASLILSNGSVTVDQLLLTNAVNSVFAFAAGTLSSGNTYVTNNQLFVVGDGIDAATFQINGGVHNFANNLEIRSNAVLVGCGVINGNVTIDPGGTVWAGCDGALTITGSVTNNGSMQSGGGSALEVYGAVVNNGTIDLESGGSTIFHSTFTNNGIVLATLEVVGIANETNGIRVTWTTPLGATNELQATTVEPGGNYTSNNFVAIFTVTNTVNPTTNFLDVGAVTNFPARYYRLRLVP